MAQTDRLYGLSTSVAVKPPCRCATTGPLARLNGLQPVDGIPIASGNRILVMQQADSSQNGIYNADTSDWIRSPDFDGSLAAVNGTILIVNEGTNQGLWRCDTTDPAVVPQPMTFSRVIYMHAIDIPVDPIAGIAPPAGNVQQALEALQSAIDGIVLAPVAAANVTFAPSGSITKGDVQAAIQKVDTDNTAQNVTLQSLQDQINALSGGAPVVIPVGLIAPYFGTNVPAGWLFCGGGTIGNPGSGANTFANDAALPLFVQLYNNSTDTELPVSGGRSGNAAADFNSGKTIMLPDGRDRAAIGWGAGGRLTIGGPGDSGIDTRVMGYAGGADRHVQSIEELAAHAHPVRITTTAAATEGIPATLVTAQDRAVTQNTTDAVGQSQPFTIVQPSIVWLWMIKW